MTASMVEAAIHDLMDFAWNVVYHLLEERGLLGDGLDVGGVHQHPLLAEGLTRYIVVQFRSVTVLFVDTRPVDAIMFHHDILGADAPEGFFRVPG